MPLRARLIAAVGCDFAQRMYARSGNFMTPCRSLAGLKVLPYEYHASPAYEYKTRNRRPVVGQGFSPARRSKAGA